MAVHQPSQKWALPKHWPLVLGGVVLLAAIFVAAATFAYLAVLKGKVAVTGLELSPGNPVSGQNIEMSVVLENSGLLTAGYHASLLVDGEETASGDVDVQHGKPQTIVMDISRLAPGDHVASIGGMVKEFRIRKPAEFKITGLAIKPGSAFVGDTVTATATVQNVGEVAGTFSSAFTYDGAKLKAQPVEIGPGEQRAVQAELTVAAKGTHAVSLDDLRQTFTAINPAKISISSLSLSKSFAKPGETITATVTLDNQGDVAGAFKLAVLVNGISAEARSVSVQANSAVTAEFKITEPKAGKYVVSSGSASQTLFVVIITRPANGALLVKKASGGVGELTIVNYYTNRDALVVLASTSDPTKAVLTVFLRKNSKVNKIKVKDGNYFVYFTTGLSFDSSSKRFVTDPQYSKYSTAIDFSTQYTSKYVQYRSWWVPVTNKATDLVEVKEDEFPS